MGKQKIFFTAISLVLFFLINCNSKGESNLENVSTEVTIMNQYLSSKSKTTAYSGAVLVARNDTVMLAKGYGLANKSTGEAIDLHTKFKIGSLTKNFTAVAVLQLVEKGALSLEDPLSKFIKGFSRGDEIKIKYLLNHSSGLPYDWREDWHENKTFTLDSVIHKIRKKKLLFEPGAGEEYSNCGYALLAKIIEITSGELYETYCKVNIFDPAKMPNTGAIFMPEKSYENFALGYEFGPGKDTYNTNLEAEFVYTPNLIGQASAYSTVADLYNFDRALRKGLLLNQQTIALLLKQLPGSEYTLGSWLKITTKDENLLSYFSGVSNGYEAVIYRYLTKDVTIVALNNHQNTDVFSISRTLNSILNGSEVYFPKMYTALAFDSNRYAHLEGNYTQIEDPEDHFKIVIEKGRIFVASHGDPLEELFRYEASKFFSKNYDLQIDFSSDSNCIWTYNGNSIPYRKQ